MSPEVSIILPTYNRAVLLNRSIQSVLNQSFENFELIVIDDNSSDNTKEIVHSFGDERIKYIKHDKNLGASEARNSGIKISKGDFVAFQDSDDEWTVNKLELILKVFAECSNEFGVVYSKIKMMRLDNSEIMSPSESINNNDGDIFREVLKQSIIGTPAAVIRKECIDKIGFFDPDFTSAEDYDFFLRLTKIYKAKFIDQPLTIAYESEISLQNVEYSKHANMQIQIVSKHIEFYRKEKDIYADKLCQIGTLFCFSENFEEGSFYFKKALRIKPNNIGFLIRYLAAILSLKINKRIYGHLKKLFLKAEYKISG